MILAREMIPEFVTFVQRMYGAGDVLHKDEKRVKRTGELGRFMLGENLVLIREHAGNAETTATTVDVYCSNRKRLEDIDRAWGVRLQQLLFEGEEDGDDVDESGD